MRVRRLSARTHLRALDAALLLFVGVLIALVLAIEWLLALLIGALLVAVAVSVWP